MRHFKEEGKWINLLGTILSDQNIQAVGTVVNKVSAGVPAATLRLDCDAVFPSDSAESGVYTLTQPPPIGAAPGAPAAPAGPVAPKSAVG